MIFEAQVFVVVIGDALGLCLVSRLGKHRKGGADQSRKVLCFVDFKLRQEKTFANKLARYLTKLRSRQTWMCGW